MKNSLLIFIILAVCLTSYSFGQPEKNDLKIIYFFISHIDSVDSLNKKVVCEVYYKNVGIQDISNFFIYLNVYQKNTNDSLKLVDRLFAYDNLEKPSENNRSSCQLFTWYGNPDNKIFEIVLNPHNLKKEQNENNNIAQVEIFNNL